MSRYANDGITAEISYGAPNHDDWPDAHLYTCRCSDALSVINATGFEERADELGLTATAAGQSARIDKSSVRPRSCAS